NQRPECRPGTHNQCYTICGLTGVGLDHGTDPDRRWRPNGLHWTCLGRAPEISQSLEALPACAEQKSQSTICGTLSMIVRINGVSANTWARPFLVRAAHAPRRSE